MKRFLIFITIAGIAIVAMSVFFHFSRPGPGDAAPGFTLPSLGGETISLEEYRGRPVLVHFWATFCGSCRKGFPSLIELQRDYKDRGFIILAISEDGKNDVALAKEFVKGHALHGLQILFDDDGSAMHSYYTFGVPEDILVDKNGVITWRGEGSVEWGDPAERRRIEELFEK